jgi:ring-1,2-phenylacetyl-CoA epoxidase subunit PaaE
METITLRVQAIRPEATDTNTIFLERADGRPLSYKAGQFLTFLFDFHGHEIRRSYSFSTTPGVDPVPAITVKRVPNGEISRYMLDYLRPGDTLTSLPPAGRFTLETDGTISEASATARPPIVFLAAGSGLVPIFSLLKQAQFTHETILITQQRDHAATPFRDQLQTLNLQWVDLLTIRQERLTNWWLEEWLKTSGTDLIKTHFYLCGPPAFMRMIQYTLRLLGVPEEHIKREHFTVERLHPAPAAFDPTPRTVTVHAGSRQYRFNTAWPESILTAGLRQGIPLPYSCRAGRCSTCSARCIEGSVRMTNNEVLTEKELAQGWVLTCVGYAQSNLILSYDPA